MSYLTMSNTQLQEEYQKLLEQFDADIVAKAAVLAEGDAAERDDIVFLGVIPLIEK